VEVVMTVRDEKDETEENDTHTHTHTHTHTTTTTTTTTTTNPILPAYPLLRWHGWEEKRRRKTAMVVKIMVASG
jgi:hypothetical protein